ncbi:hypothetical protein BpHYR1_003364 [Brachionus plicatilis]|uniref:Uncharacterized protein n=1 Tax=Brachionus plicatilis TaxID=10195 RepID=A0A3M7SJB2_BRAPC|nr:hypothetical protein BpHYR1_003364 [Brachionus plicatilis]
MCHITINNRKEKLVFVCSMIDFIFRKLVYRRIQMPFYAFRNFIFTIENQFVQSLINYETVTIDLMFNQLNFGLLNSNSEFLKNKTLILKNVSQFHLNYSRSILNNFKNVYIEHSHMEFYIDGQSLSEESNCVASVKYVTQNFHFANDGQDHFIKLTNVTYPQRSCPIFYYNLYLTSVSFDHMIKLPKKLNLGIITKGLFSSLLHGLTFDVVFLQSNLNQIDEDTFSDFFQMRRLLFQLDCNNYKKMKLMKTTYSKLYLILEDLNKDYEYPDKDFCKFIYFPHKNYVFPIIHSRVDMECTCSLTWLLMNYKLENDVTQISMKTTTVRKCFQDMEQRIVECNFTVKLAKCGVQSVQSDFYFNCDILLKSTCPLKLIEIFLMYLIILIGLPIHVASIYALIKADLKEIIYTSITCAVLSNFLVVLERYLFITNKKTHKRFSVLSKLNLIQDVISMIFTRIPSFLLSYIEINQYVLENDTILHSIDGERLASGSLFFRKLIPRFYNKIYSISSFTIPLTQNW